MTLFYIVVGGLVAAGFIAIYLPRLFVGNYEQLTREQFVTYYPEFQWIEAENCLHIPLFITLFLIPFGGIIMLQTPLSFGLFSITLAGLALSDGLLTVTTGICRVPYPKMPFRYIWDNNLKRVGWGQIILGAITILTAIGVAFYRGPL